ncbi:DUF2785 domain-containing protein [Kitasatospora herbaricolor]|uniref:DUF2785 domain-containing protein n=1 Tax=Kitasatospora herbaricolor TaxID=68217 RepID=A0ABZ1WDF9_9ACTN|nr:DUF2785 domain-containing protein [Kitasatospora herbaricolor]
MTDWQQIIDDGSARPADRSPAALVAELAEALRSPDPVLRDEQAYTLLARWIPGLDPELRRGLGDTMATRLTDPEIQTRSFAALVLADLVRNGDHRARWATAFADWYPTETDLRGHHPRLGWLHAVAHGADLLGALGRCPQVAPAPLLDLGAARLLAPATHVWDAQEDDRLARALALTLTRPELTGEQALGWLDAIAADFAAGEPGPVPAYASNTMRTLRMLYLLADRGVRARPHGPGPRSTGDVVPLTHRTALLARLAEVLAQVTPALG